MGIANLLKNPDIKNIHFIGIGGISMSGLAKILISQGYAISGSDVKSSNLTKELESLGIKFNVGHSSDNIENPDLVVYTSAIKEDNPEYVKAKSLCIPTICRATLLGEIMGSYPYSIAISGSHGKTTTTSMVSAIMINAGKDPTIHIGGELSLIGGNTRIGNGDYFIAEACEYMENFLKFKPYTAVILNIEPDHLDYFRDIEHIKNAFLNFALQIPLNGHLIACADDNNVCSLLDKIHCNKHTFGIKNTSADWVAANIRFNAANCTSFDVYTKRKFWGSVKLSVPGEHNIYNALSALVSCSIAGIEKTYICDTLNSFCGPHRRFEYKGIKDGITVIDDYAHHPSEIKATLSAIKSAMNSNIWCVFQPHTYTRTLALLDEFSKSFTLSNHVIITDIYAAREKDTGKIHSSTLAHKISEEGTHCIYIKSFSDIVDYLKCNVQKGDVILTMGAGDVNNVGEMFLKQSSPCYSD